MQEKLLNYVLKRINQTLKKLKQVQLPLVTHLLTHSLTHPGPATTVIRSTKELTIPVTPVSHLTRRLGQKVVVPEVPVTAAPVVPAGPRQLTQPEPFQFATNSRIPVTAPSESVLTNAELNEKFMKDSRSHYVPTKACSKVLTHSLTHLLTHSPNLTLTHLLTHSPNLTLTYSLIQVNYW